MNNSLQVFENPYYNTRYIVYMNGTKKCFICSGKPLISLSDGDDITVSFDNGEVKTYPIVGLEIGLDYITIKRSHVKDITVRYDIYGKPTVISNNGHYPVISSG